MPNTKGSNGSSMLLLVGSLITSMGIYLVTSPACLAPLVLFAASLGARLLSRRQKPDQDILLGFLILSLLIDDVSQVAWGRTVDTWTEAMGVLLFKSFGLTGMEGFALLFTLWILIRMVPAASRDWYRMGFLNIFTVGIAVFIASFIAGLVGIMDGGSLKTMFIQLRFLHCLPLWVCIGFAIWRDREFSAQALKWITISISIKSFQALFVYFSHYAQFKNNEEYLVDHYFSGFSVLALVCLGYYFLYQKRIFARATILVTMAAVSLAYVFNDRRTSYVGAAFAVAILPCLLPWPIIRKNVGRGVAAGAAFILFTMITWNLPPPLGFIGGLYRSFGNETGMEEPSYRDLENANLLNAVAQRPVSGLGYGKEFREVFPMPDISYVYERYRMIPHNLFLASWAFGGPLTIAALSTLFAVMIATTGALFKVAREPGTYLLGIASLFFFLQYFTYTFGDLGFQIQRNQMLAGLLLGACFRIKAQLTKELRMEANQWP